MKKKGPPEKEVRRRTRSKSKGRKPSDEMECHCLECGISNHLVLEGAVLEPLAPSETKLLANIFCSECGGPLMVRGKAGDEPFYLTD